MLMSKIQKISAETQAIKQEIYEAIVAQTPADPGDGKGFRFIFIKFSELEDSIWLPAYYMTGKQLQILSDYVMGKSERSLETIANTFKSIVETGASSAFKGVMFNKTARAVIRSLL